VPAPVPDSATAAQPAQALAGPQLVQVALVGDIPKGRAIEHQLRDAGYDAYWESVETKKGDNVVRVRVNVDPSRQTIGDTMSALRKLGYDPIPVAP
jgi:cell division septation protein DedD